jgi:proton-translocating NAD(P)+ transhydrogenase subunit alpha
MLVAGSANTPLLKALALVAVVLGAANVFGGFAVTERMLDMFKHQQPQPPTKSGKP